MLAETDWARRLARGLVQDAEDRTGRLAPRRSPRGCRALLPWLATRLRRQRQAPGDRARARTELAELVTALGEPYRQAVLLHCREGLSAAQIARRLAIPAGTVRWRLETGMDRLRAGLDARHDGERQPWQDLLRPLAEVDGRK